MVTFFGETNFYANQVRFVLDLVKQITIRHKTKILVIFLTNADILLPPIILANNYMSNSILHTHIDNILTCMMEVILKPKIPLLQPLFRRIFIMPIFGEIPPKFSGKRKYRGLYITKDGHAINADVHGSMNIGRKVIPEFSGIRDRSLAARPVVINPLKVQR